MRIALFAVAVLAAFAFGASPSSAAASRIIGNGHYCVKNVRTGKINCAYSSMARCNKFARPNTAVCVSNPKFAARARPMHSAMQPAPGAKAARVTGQSPYCLKNVREGTTNCAYVSEAACAKFARTETAVCIRNPNLATTGAARMKK